jgi:protein-L-isoaspartate O-methyltransferase
MTELRANVNGAHTPPQAAGPVAPADDDIEHHMRRGHPFLAETAAHIVETVCRNALALPAGRPVRVLEIGCASGILASQVAERLPAAQVTAFEELPELAALARRRLEGSGVALHTASLDRIEGPMDIVFSGGAHHHLPQSYLGDVRRLLGGRGVYVLGDELCPEYCHGALERRIATAEVVEIVNGYVLTRAAEVEAFARTGTVPPEAEEMERRRKQALWRWYRFVVDQAMAGGHYTVAIAELGSARDDLVSGSPAEHKMSPVIVEREVVLAGLEVRSRRVFGAVDDPSLQSFHVYELAPSAARAGEVAR